MAVGSSCPLLASVQKETQGGCCTRLGETVQVGAPQNSHDMLEELQHLCSRHRTSGQSTIFDRLTFPSYRSSGCIVLSYDAEAVFRMCNFRGLGYNLGLRYYFLKMPSFVNSKDGIFLFIWYSGHTILLLSFRFRNLFPSQKRTLKRSHNVPIFLTHLP